MPSLMRPAILNDDGTGRDRDRHQEAEACCGVAVEAEETAGRDRDARPRGAGVEGERLGGADRRPRRERVSPSILRWPIGGRRRPSSRPNDDQRDGDDPRLAEVLVDLVLEHRADEGGRDRRQQQQPGDLALGRDRLAAAEDGPPALADVHHEVLAEVGDDGDERAEVEGDVERLLGRRVVEVVPVEQPRHEQQVPARRDREGTRRAPARCRGRWHAGSAPCVSSSSERPGLAASHAERHSRSVGRMAAPVTTPRTSSRRG